MKNKVYLFLMMAGAGNRFGKEIPKQYTLVDEVPIFITILNELLEVDDINNIVCITNPNYIEYTHDCVNKLCNLKEKVSITYGGTSRNKSLLNGIEVIKNEIKPNDIVLVYDVTHPFVDKKGIKKVIEKVDEFGLATLAEYQHDTVYEINPNTNTVVNVIPRERVIAAASPEGFKYHILDKIYNNRTDKELEEITCAGAMACTNNLEMHVVRSDKINLKITYQEDFDNYLAYRKVLKK